MCECRSAGTVSHITDTLRRKHLCHNLHRLHTPAMGIVDSTFAHLRPRPRPGPLAHRHNHETHPRHNPETNPRPRHPRHDCNMGPHSKLSIFRSLLHHTGTLKECLRCNPPAIHLPRYTNPSSSNDDDNCDHYCLPLETSYYALECPLFVASTTDHDHDHCLGLGNHVMYAP
jgi:hypothetical protein